VKPIIGAIHKLKQKSTKMRVRYWLLFWMCFVAPFRNVFCDTSTTNDAKTFIDQTSGRIKIVPRGERRIRMKKKTTFDSPESDISSVKLSSKNVVSPDDVFERSPNFLQVIPFRLSDGTPMLRWRPGY